MGRSGREDGRGHSLEAAFPELLQSIQIAPRGTGGRPELLSDLEKQGVIRRFELAFELAWKTLKDYLECGGFVFDQITPRAVIKRGFAARILVDGQIWIDMLDYRNRFSHVYDETILEEGIRQISELYMEPLAGLHRFFEERTGT